MCMESKAGNVPNLRPEIAQSLIPEKLEEEMLHLHQGNKFLLRHSGGQRNRLYTRVTPLMMSTYGHHWLGNISCL